jgi:predicted metal-dependent enzyme (double-stranded beta helix superfamily)
MINLATESKTKRAPTSVPAPLEQLIGDVRAAVKRPAVMERLITEALYDAVSGPDWVPPERRRANHECYARHLLYGDAEYGFSILLLVWDHGQYSPVHSHRTWCAIGVYDGELTETRYREDPEGRVLETGIETRTPGSVTFEARDTEIHSITNKSSSVAMSIHIYGVGPEQVSTGINRLYPAF